MTEGGQDHLGKQEKRNEEHSRAQEPYSSEDERCADEFPDGGANVRGGLLWGLFHVCCPPSGARPRGSAGTLTGTIAAVRRASARDGFALARSCHIARSRSRPWWATVKAGPGGRRAKAP